MTEINAVGQPCPIPVIMTKKSIGEMAIPGQLKISVDNAVAVQNLSKMAKQSNYKCTSEKIDENLFTVTMDVDHALTKNDSTQEVCIPDSRERNTVLVLSSSTMGDGDDNLGSLLMKGFIYAISSRDTLPTTVLLYNGGTKLSVEGSDSLEDLKLLESQGVEVLTCGTCLNHYNLTDKLGVGSVTNMYVIAEKLSLADKIIQP